MPRFSLEIDQWDAIFTLGVILAVTGLAWVHPGLAIAAVGGCLAVFGYFRGTNEPAQVADGATQPEQ
ncbi:hypothetical protein [Fimbriiglobus ruber]|uniref:Uncharacterized protein n=1 Tax=Fimbriiglobus ruber TaxID=1908690 RepID=A0A225DFU4_9BACT|nr:hypothetical protein [Fimbriiglobus ruber]OWK34957.1 hypothetical protein FRUB_09799 [Fimbriiglobus ruber]